MAASAEKVEKKEAKQSLLGLEGAFTDKLGTSEKCLCCSQRTTVTVICALLVLASLWHFGMNVYARWGKPCFIWWEHWATCVTFVVGFVARLIILPIAVLTLVELKNGSDGVKYLGVLFKALLGFAALLAFDVILCIFEVNEVCESPAMDQYLECAHGWSLYAADATTDPEWNNVTHNGARLCPDICTTDKYDFSWRCDREPTYRGVPENRDDRVSSCELISTLYDMVLGAFLAALMVGVS
eukprot:COSAG05_NODE_4505_length_1486_cov_1.337419_2_plen_240_part_01